MFGGDEGSNEKTGDDASDDGLEFVMKLSYSYEIYVIILIVMKTLYISKH